MLYLYSNYYTSKLYKFRRGSKSSTWLVPIFAPNGKIAFRGPGSHKLWPHIKRRKQVLFFSIYCCAKLCIYHCHALPKWAMSRFCPHLLLRDRNLCRDSEKLFFFSYHQTESSHYFHEWHSSIVVFVSDIHLTSAADDSIYVNLWFASGRKVSLCVKQHLHTNTWEPGKLDGVALSA